MHVLLLHLLCQLRVNILNKSVSYVLRYVMHVRKNVRSMRDTWNTADSVQKYVADARRSVVEFLGKEQKGILHRCANIVLKKQSEDNTSLMERLSIGNERRKKKELHPKLKLCRVISKVNEALKSSKSTLERVLSQELTRIYHTLEKSENWFFKIEAV